MSLPRVTFLLPDGTEAPVGPGGLIGRTISDALAIDDPRVAEAHAMVSLRGGDLLLLALRGPLSVGRRKVVRATLYVGMRVELAPGIDLQVVDLVLPDRILALAWDDREPVPLVASAYLLELEPEVRLEPGFSDAAWANLWTTASEGWRIRPRGEEARRLDAGFVREAGGHTLRALELTRASAGVAPTLAATGDTRPITVVTRYDTVHLHREGGASVHIPGIPARILTELARFGAPVPWEMVARTIWKGEADRFVMRQNWDRHLKALRARLREGGVRGDLVRADGLGKVELHLEPTDQLVDES